MWKVPNSYFHHTNKTFILPTFQVLIFVMSISELKQMYPLCVRYHKEPLIIFQNFRVIDIKVANIVKHLCESTRRTYPEVKESPF